MSITSCTSWLPITPIISPFTSYPQNTTSTFISCRRCSFDIYGSFQRSAGITPLYACAASLMIERITSMSLSSHRRIMSISGIHSLFHDVGDIFLGLFDAFKQLELDPCPIQIVFGIFYPEITVSPEIIDKKAETELEGNHHHRCGQHLDLFLREEITRLAQISAGHRFEER